MSRLQFIKPTARKGGLLSGYTGDPSGIWSLRQRYELLTFPPLDYHPGAAAAYSLRSLSSSYTGPVVTVRRSSDDAEADFTASEVAGGALATWVGAGNDGFVTTWYDQSGNGYNLTQATAASQPTFSAGAVNGLPAITFSAGDLIDTAAAVVNGATLRTIFAVCSGGTSATNRIANLGDASGSGTQYAITGELAVRVGNGSRVFGASLSATHALVTVAATTGDVSGTELRVNGSAESVTSTSARTLNTQDGLSVGESLGGDVAELVIYDSDLSAPVRNDVEANLMSSYAL